MKLRKFVQYKCQSVTPMNTTYNWTYSVAPSIHEKNKLALNFLLASPTLGDSIYTCPASNFNFFWAPRQVIFNPV